MFEFHTAFGVTLLSLVAAAMLLGFVSKAVTSFQSLMKNIAYMVFILGGLNLICITYYAVKTPLCAQCGMVRDKDGRKDMRSEGMPNHKNGKMMKRLGQNDARYDERFIEMMIPHHEAAIDMAKDAIEKSNRPELKQLSQEIIAAQNKEIVQMKEWRKQWYGY